MLADVAAAGSECQMSAVLFCLGTGRAPPSLPPLLKLRAALGIALYYKPSAGAKQLFLFFYSNLRSKLYSPKIDLWKDRKKKKEKARHYSIYN